LGKKGKRERVYDSTHEKTPREGGEKKKRWTEKGKKKKWGKRAETKGERRSRRKNVGAGSHSISNKEPGAKTSREGEYMNPEEKKESSMLFQRLKTAGELFRRKRGKELITQGTGRRGR